MAEAAAAAASAKAAEAVVTGKPVLGVVSDPLAPPKNHVWVCDDLSRGDDFEYGKVVFPFGKGSFVKGDRGIVIGASGKPASIVLIPELSLTTFAKERKLAATAADVGATPQDEGPRLDVDALSKRLHGEAPQPKGAVAADGDGGAVGDDTGDVRTTWVEFDDQGKRHKPWRQVVAEATSERFRDSPHEGSPQALHLCKQMLESHGNPEAWF